MDAANSFSWSNQIASLSPFAWFHSWKELALLHAIRHCLNQHGRSWTKPRVMKIFLMLQLNAWKVGTKVPHAAAILLGDSPEFNVIVDKIRAITTGIALMLREKDIGHYHGSILPLKSSKDPKCFNGRSVQEREFVCFEWTWCSYFWTDQSGSDFSSPRYWRYL